MSATITSTSQRITISGNYKGFTSNTGSTSTVIQYSSGDAPASGDAGRFLLWKNGSNTGDWEIRFIESATSSAVTITDGGFSSVPSSSDDFVISTSLEDIRLAVPTACTKTGNSYSFNDRDFELSSGAFLADTNKNLTTKSTQTGSGFPLTYPVADGCALQFGRLIGGEANDSTETIGGCSIQFEASNDTLIFTNQNSFNTNGPILNFYGGLIESFDNGFILFIRGVGPTRIIGTIADGSMGGRLYSPASELVDTRFSGNLSGGNSWSLGGTFIRPITNAFFFQNNTAIKAFQGFQGVFSNTRFADSNTYIIQPQATSTLLFSFIDCTTFDVSKINGNTGNFEQLKSINYTVTDANGTGLTGVKVAVYDNTSTIQDAIRTSSFGNVNAINARFFRKSHNVSTPTNYAPFDIRIRKYGYQYQDFQSAVSEPIKQEFRLPINTVTVLSEASAGALTFITIDFTLKTVAVQRERTLSEIYDYCQAQLALDANMDEIEFLTSSDGNVFTFADDWHLILDASGKIGSATGKTVVFGGLGKLQMLDNRNMIDNLTVSGDVDLNALATPLTGVVADAIDFDTIGTYTLDKCTIGEVTNSSVGSITLDLDSTSNISVNTGPNITIIKPFGQFVFNDFILGSQIVVFQSGTTTEVFRTIANSSTVSTLELAQGSYDYTVMKTGYILIRATNVDIGEVPVPVSILQNIDRAYQVSSGLSYGTTASLTGTDFDVTTPTTVQNLYSFWIEQWISNSALTNKSFPISTFGPNSFSFNDGHEFTSSSLQYLSRDGFRYFNSGNVTARYCAILSQGATAGLQSEYQQEQGGAITDSLNTGNVDQVIQIFGDATHGNFDYTGYLNFKIQANGFRQAEADVVATYDTLEEQFYVISLNTPQIDDFTTGDPSITGVTITDNSNSPVSWDAGDGAKLYSVTITDTNNNTGENILRFLNYNLSLDATFQGKEPFYWPEMVVDNGSAFETLTGKLYRSSSNVIVGVRVIDNSGNAHRDFTRFQSDDGTYGIAPIFANSSVNNIVAGSRLQIYNVTTATEIYNDIVLSNSYNVEYVDGNNYTAGDTVRIRLTYQSGTSAKLGFEANASVTSAGWGVLADQKDDTVYNTIALDGSTITKFVADYVNNEIDIITAVNFSAHELYSRFTYFITTEDGIRTFFGAFRAVDMGNFINDITILDLFFNNNTSTNLVQTDIARLYKSNGVYPVRNPTTGGGGMDIVWRVPIQVVETSTSGLTATESAQLFATATQTDLNNLNDLSPQEVANSVWDEPLTGATHNVPTSSGRRLRQAGATLAFEGSVNTHVATTNAFTGNFTNTIDDFYADQVCLFLTGNLAGQARIITSYNGTTKQMTFDEPWSLAPANGDEFEIKGDHTHSLSQIQNGLASQASVDALPSAVDIDNQLISSHGLGDWTTTGVQNSINNLNNFNPATDTVARVSLVDTTTVNTDMRGTDNANTVEPPSVTAIDNQITASHGTGSYQTYSGSGLDFTEIKENQVVLNEGLKTVSLVQIHEDNLPNT